LLGVRLADSGILAAIADTLRGLASAKMIHSHRAADDFAVLSDTDSLFYAIFHIMFF
jgi:hypothetical protein